MKILDELRNFGKDIRIIRLNLSEVKEAIKDYIKQKGWVISKEENSQYSFCIVARNRRISKIRFFLDREPHIVNWFVSQDAASSKIELQFNLFRIIRYLFYSILAICLAGYIFFNILHYLKIPVEIKYYLYIIFGFLPVILLMMLSFFTILVTFTNKYEEFKNGFYLKIREISKTYEQMIVDRADFPVFFYCFFPLLFIAFLFMYITFINRLPFIFSSLFFLKTSLFFILFYFILVVFLFLKPSINTRFKLSLFGFIVGIVLSSYCLAPLFLKTSSETFQTMRETKEMIVITSKIFENFSTEELKVIVEFNAEKGEELDAPLLEKVKKYFTPEIREKIRKVKTGLGRGIIGSIFNFFVFSGIIIFFICAFKWLAGGPFPMAILNSLDLYKKGYKNLEFQSAFNKDIFFRFFASIIFTVWIICSLAAFFGIYFSFSSIEFLLLGKNLFLKNDFLKIAVTNLETFFDFTGMFIESFIIGRNRNFSGSLSEALNILSNSDILTSKRWYPFFLSRLVIILYVLPLLVIFLVFLNKWFKEIINVKKLKLTSLPDNLKKSLAEICQSNRIKIPSVILRNEPTIMSEARWLSPFGNCIIISDKALAFLNEQEFEALLAHEIGHIKNHTFIFNLLDSLSQITLFGKGFLTLILNTKEMEYGADKFCIDWLNKKGYSKAHFINLLNKTDIVNSTLKYMAYSRSLLGISDTIAMLEKPERRITFKARVKLLYALYFGDLVLSYIHPSIEERIKRMEEIA